MYSYGFLKNDSHSKANILKRQFEVVFAKGTSTMPDKDLSPYPDMPKLEVNWKGVHKLLKGLKTFKATGPGTIPASILKVMNCGEIPTELKDAWIVPVFKKGDKQEPANYRPVSLTSITCKLLENIVHSNVMAHFDRHNIIKDNQYGFRKKRSCKTQLIITIQEIASRLAKDHPLTRFLIQGFCTRWTASLGGSVGCSWRPGGREFNPAEVSNILSWRLIMKYFLRSFSPFRRFKKGSCQFLVKECAQYWLTA